MQDHKTIVTATGVREFFEEAVATAWRQQQVEGADPVRDYVVDLLCEYTARPGVAPADQPLALLMARSERSGPARRVRQLKEVGDRALYIAGFFAESLARHDLDVAYYNRLGGTAYRRLSRILDPPRPRSRVAEIYAELSRLFEDLVVVLALVREQGPGELDLRRAYDLWMRTGSVAAERRLREAGITPVAPGTGGPAN